MGTKWVSLGGKVRAKGSRPFHTRQETGTCLWEAVGKRPVLNLIQVWCGVVGRDGGWEQ